jgi:hypothetical protein
MAALRCACPEADTGVKRRSGRRADVQARYVLLNTSARALLATAARQDTPDQGRMRIVALREGAVRLP